jgi:hypothetical protein
VTWVAPYDGGSPITSYVIQLLQSDGVTFSENMLDCNGTKSSVVSTTTCTVPIASMRATPYSLPWGSNIRVRVSAQNIIGTSPFSVVGSGAIILTYPDAPLSLTKVTDLTAGT